MYGIIKETYREHFHAQPHVVKRPRESCLCDWLTLDAVERVKESIVQAQLLNCLAPHIRVWVKEWKPKLSLEAEQLADDYFEARNLTKDCMEPPSNRPDTPTQCSGGAEGIPK